MQENDYFSTIQAAKMLGVSVTTIKRWVDEGILKAYKTPGGHRKISLSELQRLKAIHGTDALPAETLGQSVDPLAEQFLRVLLRSDQKSCDKLLLDAWKSGVSIAQLGDTVIAPTMTQIGHQWQTGELDVYHEHQATQMCLQSLSTLRTHLPTLDERARTQRPLAIGGGPEEDHYLLANFLVELVFREVGWNVKQIGPNTPFASFHRALEQENPRLLWISCSYLPNPNAFVEGCQSLVRAAHRSGVAVAIGGRALTPEFRQLLPDTILSGGLEELAAFGRKIYS